MAKSADLPIIDLNSPDLLSTAKSVRKACTEHGFFYIINHGVDERLCNNVFEEIKRLFSLPNELKMEMARKSNTSSRGYTGLYLENSDPTASSKGDYKENFDIGPLEDLSPRGNLNIWPSEGILPCFRSTMEDYYKSVLDVAKRLMKIMSVALNLSEDYFEQLGAFDDPDTYLSLLHYPGELEPSDEENYGIKAHSDYGMITLLATNGVPGLQICRDRFKQPQVWEDVNHINGAFIVNIGGMMERWTNDLFRATLHRVKVPKQERYSAAFQLAATPDCLMECIKSCCSESSPPRFPPIRAGDYLEERFKLAYA